MSKTYGTNQEKNQELFDVEMELVSSAIGFNELYERLLQAYVINPDGYSVRNGGIRFSKDQTAKIIGWSRDSVNGSDKEHGFLKYNIEKSVLNMLRLGSLCVSISEDDLEYCLDHDNKQVRHIACWRFDLLDSHIDKVLDSNKDEFGFSITMSGIVIDRYAKNFNAAQIEKVQLTCGVYDCCSMWFEDVGDSPIEKLPGRSKADFVSSYTNEMFELWKASYRAKVESEKLKSLSVVSELGSLGKCFNVV